MWSRSNKEAPGAGSELEGKGGRQWGQKGNKGFTSLCMDLGFYSEQSKESSEKFLRKGVEWQGFHFKRTSLAAPLRVDRVCVYVCVCVCELGGHLIQARDVGGSTRVVGVEVLQRNQILEKFQKQSCQDFWWTGCEMRVKDDRIFGHKQP